MSKTETNTLAKIRRRIGRQFTALEKIVEREALTAQELDVAHQQVLDERMKYGAGMTTVGLGVLGASTLKAGITAPMAIAPLVAAGVAVVRAAHSDEKLPETDRTTVERAIRNRKAAAKTMRPQMV